MRVPSFFRPLSHADHALSTAADQVAADAQAVRGQAEVALYVWTLAGILVATTAAVVLGREVGHMLTALIRE